MLTIIGLGNPLPEYAKTRHNIGQEIVSAIAKEEDIELTPKKLFLANINKTKIENKSTQLVLPQTYMNESGKTLKKLFPISTAKTEHQKLLIIHDDLDLPIGVIKMVYDSGSGGHKGIESINKALKNKKYFRLKIGVTPIDAKGNLRKPKPEKMPNFITGKFTDDELKIIKKAVTKAVGVVRTFIGDNPAKAMEMANRRG